MLHLEAEWPSKENTLKAQFWQNQTRSQVLRFWGENTFLGGKIIIFIICLKEIF